MFTLKLYVFGTLFQIKSTSRVSIRFNVHTKEVYSLTCVSPSCPTRRTWCVPLTPGILSYLVTFSSTRATTTPTTTLLPRRRTSRPRGSKKTSTMSSLFTLSPLRSWGASSTATTHGGTSPLRSGPRNTTSFTCLATWRPSCC